MHTDSTIILSVDDKIMKEVRDDVSKILVIGYPYSGMTSTKNRIFENNKLNDYTPIDISFPLSLDDAQHKISHAMAISKVIAFVPDYYFELSNAKNSKTILKDFPKLWKDMDQLIKSSKKIKHYPEKKDAENIVHKKLDEHQDLAKMIDKPLREMLIQVGRFGPVYLPKIIVDTMSQWINDLPNKKNRNNYMTKDFVQNEEEFLKLELDTWRESLGENLKKREILLEVLGISSIIGLSTSVVSTFKTAIEQAISPNLFNSLPVLSQALSCAVPGGFLVSAAIEFVKKLKDKSNPHGYLQEFVKAQDYWEKLTQIEQDLICYELDKYNRRKPGTSKNWLKDHFTKKDEFWPQLIEEITPIVDDIRKAVKDEQSKNLFQMNEITTKVESLETAIAVHEESIKSLQHKMTELELKQDAFDNRLKTQENEVMKIKLKTSRLESADTISYIKFDVPDWEEISRALNVTVSYGKNDTIGFVMPRVFEQTMQSGHNILLAGKSGCGKSRLIYETIKSKMKNKSNYKIFIINPETKNKPIEKTSVREFVDKIDPRDIVVWDNFPKGITLSSKIQRMDDVHASSVQILFNLLNNLKSTAIISIEPNKFDDYQDMFTNNADIGIYVKYTKDEFEKIIQELGKTKFYYNVYRKKLVGKDIKRISEILWQKERTPLAIDLFYRVLKSTNQSAIQVANELKIPTEWFSYQLKNMKANASKQNQLEFLYTLKLCYMFEESRDRLTISKLQEDIFNSSSPKHMSDYLSEWVSISGGSFSMHDTAKSSIEYDDDVLDKITQYLISHKERYAQRFEIGEFLGSNVRIIGVSKLLDIIIHGYLNHFVTGTFRGIGLVFDNLDHDDQERVLKFAREYNVPISILGSGIGQVFFNLSHELQSTLLNLSKERDNFARGLGFGIGLTFDKLEPKIQISILGQDKTKRGFASGLTEGLGHSYERLKPTMQYNVLKLARKYRLPLTSLGNGIIKSFPVLSPKIQNILLKFAKEETTLALGIIKVIGTVFDKIAFEKQVRVLKMTDMIKTSTSELSDLGRSIGQNFYKLKQKTRNEVLKTAKNNEGFANGLGDGMGGMFYDQSSDLQNHMVHIAVDNKNFAQGFVSRFGDRFDQISSEEQDATIEFIQKNHISLLGLGIGISGVFQHMKLDDQDKILDLAKVEGDFIRGLFQYRLFWTFSNLKPYIQNKILDLIEERIDLVSDSSILNLSDSTSLKSDVKDRILEIEKRFRRSSYSD